MIKDGLDVKELPSVAGFAIPGAPGVFISNPSFLNDIYVTHNAYLSKHPVEMKAGAPLLNATIVSQPSDNPEYPLQRKVLSSAFLRDKQKMSADVIKTTVLNQIASFQREHGDSFQYNLVDYLLKQQSSIIINVLCGRGQAEREIPYRNEDESSRNMSVADFTNQLINDFGKRTVNSPMAAYAPKAAFNKADEAFLANVAAYRQHLMSIISDRKAGVTASFDGDTSDLLSIMI